MPLLQAGSLANISQMEQEVVRFSVFSLLGKTKD
jgi:hypothetical protein